MARRLRPVGADFAGPEGAAAVAGPAGPLSPRPCSPRSRAARLRALLPRAAGRGDAAPLRLTFVARTTAPPERVHHALVEDVTAWPRWFRAVRLARPLDGKGRRRREIRLVGGVWFHETVMAVDAPRRCAYRVDSTNVPFLRAVLADWRLVPSGGGTLVRWTLAMDAPPAVRWLVLLTRPVPARAFRGALRALDARLAAKSDADDTSGMRDASGTGGAGAAGGRGRFGDQGEDAGRT
ncbi:SRPBCC family protein [Streptomyces sp. CA-181903]|uniref:SRPBCC family protein n=1 Tax=Streptomyces sp. CA-181903 TaxID=3240055 RepID=UPI003D90538E